MYLARPVIHNGHISPHRKRCQISVHRDLVVVDISAPSSVEWGKAEESRLFTVCYRPVMSAVLQNRQRRMKTSSDFQRSSIDGLQKAVRKHVENE